MGILDALKLRRLKDGLAKTRDALASKVNRLVLATGRVDGSFLEQLDEILIGADVGVETSQQILAALELKVKQLKYQTAGELNDIVHAAIAEALGGRNGDEDANPFARAAGTKPYVIMVIGVNGVGKTTTVGKLAYNFRMAGKEVLIGAADTFRAAANEQLEIWAARAGVKIIQQEHGSDPAAVAFDTVRAAAARGADLVIIDTAGRLHTKVNLMEELKKIRRVLDKAKPGAPNEVLLVLDASTGQNALQQAKQFHAAVGLTGLVITKLDGTAKGGVVLAIARSLGLPVRFVGVGERIDDLQPFDRKAFVDALFSKEST